MKTREELAREYAEEYIHVREFSHVEREDSNLRMTAYSAAHYAHLAGFDAGFARAVEMLRSEAAKIYELEHEETHKNWVVISPSTWGDWLEKQTPDETIAEDKE